MPHIDKKSDSSSLAIDREIWKKLQPINDDAMLTSLEPDQIVQKVSSILANAILFSKNIEPFLSKNPDVKDHSTFEDFEKHINNPVFVTLKLLKELLARKNENQALLDLDRQESGEDKKQNWAGKFENEGNFKMAQTDEIKVGSSVDSNFGNEVEQIKPIQPIRYILGGSGTPKLMELLTKDQLDALPRGILIKKN